MQSDQARKYIHDMANTISIVDASISRAITLINRSHPEMEDELARLRKADEFVKKTIQTLREFREHIHSEIKKEQSL